MALFAYRVALLSIDGAAEMTAAAAEASCQWISPPAHCRDEPLLGQSSPHHDLLLPRIDTPRDDSHPEPACPAADGAPAVSVWEWDPPTGTLHHRVGSPEHHYQSSWERPNY